MSEGPAELTTIHVLPDVQRRAIVGLADIRRRSQSLSSHLDLISQDPVYSQAIESVRTTYDDQSQLVREVMRGDSTQDPTADDTRINNHLSAATSYVDFAPNLAALHFAKAAFMQQKLGRDYSGALEEAKKYIDLANKRNIPKATPADFLPEAYILRIARCGAEGVDIPPPSEVARAIQSDPPLLKDYALILSEGDRDEFLAEFPENQRHKISLMLDQSVSSVLDRKLISEPVDVEQREAVKERVTAAFQDSIEALKSIEEGATDEDGRGLGSRWSARRLTETLTNLGEEDSLRVLKDVTDRSTREVKDLNKEVRKRPLSQRTQALQPFLSFHARVLDTLIEIDSRRGGTLAMRYLEMSALPDRLFNFFANKLIAKEYLTKNLAPFMSNDNSPVLKKLMAKHGPQFNTIIDTLSQTSDYSKDHKLAPREEELFEALSDLQTLTPRIFERYRRLPKSERVEFAQRIRELKPQFFRNAPIKDILERSDRDILTEMVYIAYKPMGMTFEQVGSLIGKVDDHTQDLDSYTFPEDGYPLTLEGQGRYVVKEKQRIDIDSLWRYRNLFVKSPGRAAEGKDLPTPFALAFSALLQPENGNLERVQGMGQNERLNALLLPLQEHARIIEFLERYGKTNETAHSLASELAEITGVYFHDNYSQALGQYLTDKPAELEQILILVNNQDIRSLISERMRQFNKEVDWQELDRSLSEPEGIRRILARPTSVQPQHIVSKILAELIEFDQMEPIRKHIGNELSKFAMTSDAGSIYRGRLKAYFSKNVGSFFAKAAAGICTKQDIPLFERKDHFHINVVENDETVRANVQAYIEPVDGRDGKPSLVLRGFNPTADWIGKIDVGNFCEQIIAIAREFQEVNGLNGVYITEQGGWHALSNRDQVARYLEGRYIKGKPETSFPLQVASTYTVQNIYKV